MPKIERLRVKEWLSIGTRTEIKSTTEQGKALEDLICYIFGQVPGISVTRRNRKNVFETEEIDIAFWNERNSSDGFPFLPNIILVECKNWSAPVGSEQVSWFDTKLRNRGQTFGVLIAANGITGEPNSVTASHYIIASALREQRQMIVLTGTELLTLSSTHQIVHLVKEKLCDLAVMGTVL